MDRQEAGGMLDRVRITDLVVRAKGGMEAKHEEAKRLPNEAAMEPVAFAIEVRKAATVQGAQIAFRIYTEELAMRDSTYGFGILANELNTAFKAHLMQVHDHYARVTELPAPEIGDHQLIDVSIDLRSPTMCSIYMGPIAPVAPVVVVKRNSRSLNGKEVREWSETIFGWVYRIWRIGNGME